jgi:hypothetical protein
MSRLPDSYVSRKDELIFDDKFTAAAAARTTSSAAKSSCPSRKAARTHWVS